MTEVARQSDLWLSDLRVLVVEDDPDSRELFSLLLELHGADVRLTGSVPEALDALDRSSYDVLASDIGLPGMTGYDLIRTIRSRDGDLRHLPAIAVTAFAMPGDRAEALEAGFDAHIAKPIEAKALVGLILAVTRRVEVLQRLVEELAERKETQRMLLAELERLSEANREIRAKSRELRARGRARRGARSEGIECA